MASNIFNRLELQAFRAGITPRTKESREWFQKKASNLRSINRQELMKEDPLKSRAQLKRGRDAIGTMQMFFYDPKFKEELPYYDAFPLVIVVGPAEGGFYGLNLHYLPPVLRAKVLDALLGDQPVPKKYIAPMIKHYLNSHVKSRFALVDKPEWEIATFLPTAQFEKLNAGQVYTRSRKMIK